MDITMSQSTISERESFYRIPTQDEVAIIERPLTGGRKTMAKLEKIATFLSILIFLACACFAIYCGFSEVSGDHWLISRIITVIIVGFVLMIGFGIIAFLVGLVNKFLMSLIVPETEELFLATLRDGFDAEPVMTRRSGYDDLYGYDHDLCCLFKMWRDGDNWKIMRLPFSAVKRIEALSQSSSHANVTTGAFGNVNINHSVSSEYGIRLHYKLPDGTPHYLTIPFGEGEGQMQLWLTAFSN